LNDVGAQGLLAQALLAGGEPGAAARAVDLLETATAKGEVWPVTVLASLYAKGGGGVPVNGPRAVALLQPFADGGHAAALVGLGDIYAKGSGTVAVDLPRARALFEQAADTGDLAAMNRLGFMLVLGQGGAADAARGLDLLDPVMAGGDTWAMLQLADLYAEGATLPLDGAKALQYYARAAERGNAAGLTRIGLLYQRGLAHIATDPAAALDYFERAAAAGDGGGRIYLALMLLERASAGDMARAVQLLDAAAMAGDAWATTILADLLIRGDRIDADGPRALALLEPLAEKGNAAALASLGNLYATGVGAIAADTVRAAGYFEAAAALDDYGAKSRFGLMLLKGEGVKADPARGLALLQNVASIGDGWAKIQLGDVLASGETVPLDADAALAAYQSARDAGLAAGAIKLGNLYLTGKGAIAPDPTRAAAYFAEAADSGESVGQVNLALLLLDGKGVTQDVKQAVGLLRRAAGAGDAWANGTLGGLYADGRHLPPDYDNARLFSVAAAKAGDSSAMLRLGILLATGPLAQDHRAEGMDLVDAAVVAQVPNAVVERARLHLMGLAGPDGGPMAESALLAELDDGNPAALRLLLQLYRAGGPGLKARPAQAQSLLDANSALLALEAVAFETIALRALPPATEQSLADIGAALGGIASTDLSQTVQMLFWGNKNAYVFALQRGLRDAGLYDGPLNGYLGQATISAINRVCRQLDAEATCAAGPLTPDVAILLGNYLASQSKPLQHS
jgi:TPR repeat protein